MGLGLQFDRLGSGSRPRLKAATNTRVFEPSMEVVVRYRDNTAHDIDDGDENRPQHKHERNEKERRWPKLTQRQQWRGKVE
ncbi:hypothetical protein V6N13_125345 [Hibiscus sabdariffa]